MTVDSELNLLCDDEEVAYQFRKTLFDRYSGREFEQPEKYKMTEEYFLAFKDLIERNQEQMRSNKMIIGHAVPFFRWS